MEEKYPVIEFSERTDKIMIDGVRCPQCGDNYFPHVAFAHVPCRKCNITFKTDFKQDVYTKSARKILSIISKNNGIIFKAEEKYESDITLIKRHFEDMMCWNVSELDQFYDEYKRCEKCGTCLECVTCQKCGTAFKKDKRKLVCPKCKTSSFVKTYFKEVYVNEENKSIKKCPFCNSTRISMTKTKNKTKCSECGSDSISESKIERKFSLTIERKDAYKK